MSYPVTKDPIPLPMPLSGFNTRDPLESMDPSFSPWLLNMEPEPRFLKVRGAWEQFASISGNSGDFAVGLGNYNDTNLFVYAVDSSDKNKITDITAGGAFSTPDHTTVDYQTTFGNARYAAGKLWFGTILGGTSAYYNGSAWADNNFTYSGSEIYGYALTTYRGRVYLLNGQYLYYSALSAITGATTRVDLTTIFSYPGSGIWIETMASPIGKESETLLVIGNTSGEILVYTGDNPAAANWEQIASLKSEGPTGIQPTLKYKSDILVSTKEGIISVRGLMSAIDPNGPDAIVSYNINPYFIDLANQSGYLFGNGSMAYDRKNARIYVLMHGQLDRDGTFRSGSAGDYETILVYNTISKAWCVHQIDIDTDGYLKNSLTYFNGALYFAGNNQVFKYNLDAYVDEDLDGSSLPYSYAMHSAYTNLGSPNKYKTARTVEPIIKTDFTGSAVGVKVDADFDKATSAETSNALLDGRQSPVYTVGEKGAFLQYRIEGTADANSSDGLEIYSVGMSLK